MILSQTRIKSVEKHFGFLDIGTNIILGVRNIHDFQNTLERMGFSIPITAGEKLLPSADFGPVSRFNADGKDLVHRDRPKETVYYLVEWTREEWRGYYDTETVTDFIERPVERYPRTFVSPPSIELTIATDAEGEFILISPLIEYSEENYQKIKHITNLFLEIFGECEILSEELESIEIPRVRRVNWEILPPGEYPWERLEEHVREILENTNDSTRPVIEHRLSTINSYEPSFRVVGNAGFRGYFVFGFPERNLYIFESAFYGNATYVFREDWEELSRLTKSEILDENLQEERIIHRTSWDRRIRELLSEN